MIFIYEVRDLTDFGIILKNIKNVLMNAIYIVPETLSKDIKYFLDTNDKMTNIIRTEIMIAKQTRSKTGENKLVNRTRTMYNSFDSIYETENKSGEITYILHFDNPAENPKTGFIYPYYLEFGDESFKPFHYILYSMQKTQFYDKDIEKTEYDIINNISNDILKGFKGLI